MNLMPHLIVAPILLPLFTAACMLLLGEKHRPLKARINLGSTLLGLCISITLLLWTQQTGSPTSIGVYLPSNWQVPFGIVLVVDRLSALMLVLTGVIASCALMFAMARWDRAGSSFHALFQIQLMGLYGAFLTADLFNLFVFFEEFPVERWDSIIAINLSSVFHSTRLTLPGMRKRGWGRIVNIASVHGLDRKSVV